MTGIPDFSASGVPAVKTSELLHEFTHVWQEANWGGFLYGIRAALTHNYKYTLGPNTRFRDLNMEQQAMVVQDRYLSHQGLPPLTAQNQPTTQDYDDVFSQVHH
jgi:hypothetical protein